MRETRSKKILIFQPVVPQYRLGFFRALSKALDGNLEVCATQRRQSGFMVDDGSTAKFFLRNIRTFTFGRLLIQPYMVRAVFRRDVDVIIAMNQMTRIETWALLLAKKVIRKKVILWGHGCSPRDGKYARLLRPYMMRLADADIVYREAGQRRACASGILKDKVFVAPNALDTNALEAARSAISNDELHNFQVQKELLGREVFLFVGRLLAYKKIGLLIDAVERLVGKHPGILALIIGDGPDREVLLEDIRSRRLEQHVRLLGSLFDEAVLCKYFISSIAGVMPSAAGLFVQHAFQYGLPVITDDDMSAHGPEVDILEHGKTGLFFKSEESRSLADAMESFLENPELYREMSVAAREKVIREHTLDIMLSGYLAAIDSVRRNS